MKHISQTPLGRPVPAGRMGAAPEAASDKWALLDALTEAGPAFGLKPRALAVLRALLSFLPTRGVPEEGAMVFASNAAISARLHGMPESTLRRQIADILRAGVMVRRDSPNRKRYARRVGGRVALAFGFDLSPLRHRAGEIARAAREARLRAERMEVLRQEIALARHRLAERDPSHPMLEEARLALRRKPDEEALARIRTQVEEALGAHAAPADSAPCPGENERHIQRSKEDPDIEKSGEDELPPAACVIEGCAELTGLLPGTEPTWPSLCAAAQRIAPMIGVEPRSHERAVAAMGPERAALSILCILERLGDIRRPSAYLEALSREARRGRLRAGALLAAIVSGQSAGVVS